MGDTPALNGKTSNEMLQSLTINKPLNVSG